MFQLLPNSPMEKFLWQDMIKVNICILRALGLLPKSDQLVKSDPYTYLTIFVILCCTTHVSFQAINIRDTYLNLELLTQTILFCFAEYLAVFKMISFVTKAKMLKGLLLDLDADIFQPKNVRQVLLIAPDIHIWKMIYRTLMTGSSICLVLSCLVPVLTGSVKNFVLPLPAWYPYDIEEPILYTVTYIYQILGTWFIGLTTYNVDMLIAALMMYTGAQCDLLCDNLQNLSTRPDHFEKMLKRSVNHYEAILRFAENSNQFFNLIMLAQFFVSSTCLALSLFRLALETPSTFDFYIFLCAVITFIMEIFTYCWFGNKIQTKSEKIVYSLFQTCWINQSSANKKNLIIFGQRARFPIKLSTFKLFYLTLETFVRILRSGVSYYTVLRQLNGSK